VEELVTKQDLNKLGLRIDGELRLLNWRIGANFAGVVSLVMKAFFIA
jgi:hypothetical protein